MIMEYAEGGELFNYILEKKYLSEDESRNIFQQIIDAVYYLHQIGVCHRDLKLENILFSTKKKDKIKIIDFGLSNLYLTGVNSENPALAFGADFLETPCGSPGYTPPEMILGCKYDGLLTDIWSSGIILYSMLCGFLPFDDPSEEKLYSKIIKGEFLFPSHINISEDAKLLIGKILVVNPRLRANIKDIRRSPWFLKDYKPTLGLYISIREIPVSNIIIEEMEKNGFDKNKIIDNIKNNRHNKITTFYYLLVNKFHNEGIETESDLISNTFYNYLKEQDLKNKLTKKGEKPISLKIMKYNSKSIFDLEEDNNDQNASNQNYDLEYFKNLLKDDIFNNSEENNENSKEKKDNEKNKLEDKKIKQKKNNKAKSIYNKDVNIHPLKIKTENNYNLNKINEIKIVENKNKKAKKKHYKESFEKISINIHKKNKLSEKDKNNIDILDCRKKYSYSTSINKKKSKNALSEEKIMKLSYNKNRKLKFEDYQKIIKKNVEENKKKTKKNLINKENEEKKSKINKISKLSLLQKNNNKINININTNLISSNRINTSINRDIFNRDFLTNINTNIKVNQIKKIKDQNLKKLKNKKRNYLNSFNKGITSRNYLKIELNDDEIKTTRQYKNKYILKSTSNSKSKSSKSKSILSTEKNKEKDSKKKKKKFNYNYFNVKINIQKAPLLTEGSSCSRNKYSSLSKDNKNNKTKSNSISKTKYKNKIKSNDILNRHKKYIKSRDRNKKNNKKSITMKKLDLNKLNNLKDKNLNNKMEEINSHFNTIKSIENHLTERNNYININNIFNNKKLDYLENKEIKNFSSTLQKIIPSLKGLTIKDKKPILKKSLINLMVGLNNNNQNKDRTRKSNNDIIRKISKNKIIKKLETFNNKNKELSQNNKNIIYNNPTRIRKISPVNQNKKIVKSLVAINTNCIENKKELSKINKNKLKINPIKIKEIKSIKICNIPKNDTKSKTSRRSNNNSDYKEISNFKNKFFEEFNQNLGVITFNKEKTNNKKWRNINEMLIGILTKNKINAIKKDHAYEYICKKGNNKIVLELSKTNDMDSYSISINNINSSQKEFESFKKHIINIFNLNKKNN